jgi:hypothetical protein
VEFRHVVYMRAKHEAQMARRGSYPICPHCDAPVEEPLGGNWEECHLIPKTLGGRRNHDNIRPGHPDCNRRDGHKVCAVAAKINRLRQRKPARHPFPCGVNSNWTKPMHGVPQRRRTGAERHAAFVDGRALRDADGKPIGVWAKETCDGR